MSKVKKVQISKTISSCFKHFLHTVRPTDKLVTIILVIEDSHIGHLAHLDKDILLTTIAMFQHEFIGGVLRSALPKFQYWI